MKKKGVYVGVTGFMNLAEVVTCNNVFCEAKKNVSEHVDANLKFMVGILVSSKTLAGGTNKYPNRYPPVTRIHEITSMQHQDHLLYTIHYNTDDANTIDDQIDQVMHLSPSIDAIQLNMRWASPIKLQKISRKHPDLRIILQIGSGALEDIKEPGEVFLGTALKTYENVIDDYLVDSSGGEGRLIDVWHAFACISDDEIPSNLQANVAGRLNADNVPLVRGLVRRLKKPVGLDAESQLRTPRIKPEYAKEGEDLGDHMNLFATENYIREGVAFVGSAMMNQLNNTW